MGKGVIEYRNGKPVVGVGYQSSVPVYYYPSAADIRHPECEQVLPDEVRGNLTPIPYINSLPRHLVLVLPSA